uniref:Mesotocin receptor-like n=1 Tax=Saccoglossus kowalevskii TaxID=10224 RepID=A0ABM0GXB7_SACKO|nr:PREDICTED: mesotocin receptor-like [Saccoglossus kowalevskii]
MSANASANNDDYIGIDYNRQLRLIILAVMFIFSLIGNIAVFVWMWFNRRSRNRINSFMMHLCTADLLVAILALLTQFIVELLELNWLMGDVGCRLFKIVQCFALFASSNMVVAIAVDRYHSVIYPFQQRKNVNTIIVPSWVIAFVFSIPQAFVWHLVNDANGNKGCHTSLQKKWEKQAYLTWVGMIVFFIPFVIITLCYLRIIVRLWEKRNTVLPGKSERRRKAKMKTLKMTFVIISFFVICGLPYFALDMYRFYGDSRSLDRNAVAVLGIFSVSHCVVNPFIFLAFNVKSPASSQKYQENSTVTTAPTKTSL